MVTPTFVRAGKVTALLAGLQSAKGTPVDDFTSGPAARIWTREVPVDAGAEKSDPTGWMTRGQVETGARYNREAIARGKISALATPTALQLLLRSNWGAFAAGEFTLAEQVSEWLSLGWVENVQAGATEYFYRLHDGLVDRILLKASPSGPLLLEADYAAESDTDPVALDALGSIELPAPPMEVDDKNVFPGSLVKVYRDPAGDNEEIAAASIEISIDQRLGSEWDQMRGMVEVFKAGHPGPLVELRISGRVGLETWRILSASRAGTKQAFRLIAQAQAPATTFQIDLHEVDFVVDPIGHVGCEYVRFVGAGQAHLDDDDNFVTILLS